MELEITHASLRTLLTAMATSNGTLNEQILGARGSGNLAKQIFARSLNGQQCLGPFGLDVSHGS